MTDRRITRRAVLGGGLVAGAALATGGSWGCGSSAPAPAPPRAAGSRPDPRFPAGTDRLPQIDHIVVLMMENHSYDNYFGLLGRKGADGFTVGTDGLPTNSNPTAGGTTQHAFHMPTTCQLQKQPSQDWTASHTQYNGGRNDGFVRSASGPVAMGYWTQADLPFYHGLARTFPVCDRWFCSVLAQTYPNRRYLLAGTSLGQVSDNGDKTPFPRGTIMDMLDAHGVSWKNYFSDVGSMLLIPGVAANPANGARIVPIDHFFADAKAGTLPGFSLVDPRFSTDHVGTTVVQGTSEENPQNVAEGEAFAASVINAVMAGAAWPKTLLVYVYDEHGGYYDHVPPPAAVPPDDVPPEVPPGQQFEGFGRYGFRVPAVVASPYARPNYVSHVVHDHTSVLKLVETKWNLPALTRRDANADNLLDCVDLSAPPAFLHPPALPAPGVIQTNGADRACSVHGPGTIPPPASISR